VSVGVLFGGPTPSTDISILTDSAFTTRAVRFDVVGIYWTKTGMSTACACVEAEAFLDGLPQGSSELSLAPRQSGRLLRERPHGQGSRDRTRAVVLHARRAW